MVISNDVLSIKVSLARATRKIREKGSSSSRRSVSGSRSTVWINEQPVGSDKNNMFAAKRSASRRKNRKYSRVEKASLKREINSNIQRSYASWQMSPVYILGCIGWPTYIHSDANGSLPRRGKTFFFSISLVAENERERERKWGRRENMRSRSRWTRLQTRWLLHCSVSTYATFKIKKPKNCSKMWRMYVIRVKHSKRSSREISRIFASL